jgi:hypothetical protein
MSVRKFDEDLFFNDFELRKAIMKTPRIILALLIVQTLSLLGPQLIFSQTDTLDVVTYLTPKGWTKTPKDNAVSLSNINKTTNGFCVITIYASTPSQQSPQENFASRWNELIVKPYQGDVNPKTESQTDDGWTSISSAAGIEIEGVKSFALLTVFTGYGKTASVVSILNDQAYLAQLDAFMAGLRLNKTKTSVNPSSKDQTGDQTTAPPVSSNNTPGKFGHLIYKPMPGWKEKIYSNAVSFTPSVLPPEFAIEVRIMQSKPFSGNIQQAFAESWNDALQQLEMASVVKEPTSAQFDNAPVEAKVSYQGWEYMNGQGYFIDKNNNAFYLDLFVIKVNNRIERMFAVAQQIKQTYGVMRSLNQNTEYNMVYNDFFYSVKFDDWSDKALPSGALSGNAILGVYAGFKLSNFAATDISGLEGSYAVLFSNGQVYYTTKVHPYGFDGLNTQSEANLHARNWGTYQIQNGRGEFKMPYGALSLALNEKGFVLTTQNTPHQYIKLPSIDGAVFNGTYFFEGTFSGQVNPSITFTPDGRFIDNGAVNILYHNFQEKDSLNLAAKPGSGTYQAKNYSVIFNYSDGRKIQIAFSGLLYDKKNPGPATLTLSFNNDVLTKR